MKPNIKFGTDGWRGVIAEDFTFENIKLVSAATAKVFLEEIKNNTSLKNLVFIGYDRRFLGKEFANCATEVFSQYGLNVNLYKSDVPTPMVSFDVKKNQAVGGVVITASHNPPEFSGFKIKRANGSSADKEYTDKIEKELWSIFSNQQIILEQIKSRINYKMIEPSKEYFDYIKKTIDINLLKNLSETIIVDAMHGAGGNYIEHILSGGNLKIKTIRSERDILFGGINPEPMMPQLTPLCEEVIKSKAFLGLATDGDADRVGAIDEKGEYINTHKILAILLYYLVEKRKLSGGVIVTVSQSVLVKKMAQKYGLKIYEVPIGFKNIAELMLKEDILIGGEEANGIGCKLHYMPDRDGIFNSVLLLEAINSFKLKPSELIKKLHNEYGPFYYDRVDLHIPKVEMGKDFIEKIKLKPPSNINGLKVKEVKTLDGTKLIFTDDSWLLFRASGTEPLLRIYCESNSNDTVHKMLQTGEDLFKSTLELALKSN